MLKKIVIRNFKRFEDVEVPLGDGFVFAGPNNSGKTSALQALVLWSLGVRTIQSRPKSQYARAINKLALVHLPVRHLAFLWYNRKVRKETKDIPMHIIVSGIKDGNEWEFGVEFTYKGDESLYCKPMERKNIDIIDLPRVVVLPPMSGLAQVEPQIQEGRIDVLIGEGRTAEVLRNICYDLVNTQQDKWNDVKKIIKKMFGVELRDPEHDAGRGEIYMEYYYEGGGKKKTDILDLQSAGRGFQQTLMLLAFLCGNKADVILMDEPDAHLEILRQREVYKTLQNIARREGRQIIAASHSEVLVKETAPDEKAVFFSIAGNPHIVNCPQPIMKSLADIGFEYYTVAQKRKWMLYLESAADMNILVAFAEKLKHDVLPYLLHTPPVKYLETNLPQNARNHFHGLQDAIPELVGVMLIDHVEKQLNKQPPLVEMMWNKREIENYLCVREALEKVVTSDSDRDVFGENVLGDLEKSVNHQTMVRVLDDMERVLNEYENLFGKTKKEKSLYSDKYKASDNFLVPLFKNYQKERGVATCLGKSEFFKIVEFIPNDKIDPEITKNLDVILKVAKSANGLSDS